MHTLVLGLWIAAGISWSPWSDAVFTKAARENRLVLLDVGAVWCHWCHVMDATTYKDPDVLKLLADHYVPVRADADGDPDLANRYEDYGWPATIVFDATGKELVKFRGYVAPARMKSLLAGVVEDPTPGPSAETVDAVVPDTVPADLDAGERDALETLVVSRYDVENGGWGFVHKYLDADSLEYSMRLAAAGDKAAESRARETLTKVAKYLVDPVWGGLYQYSDGGVWENPHFEKIMSFQAEGLRIFSLASTQWRDPVYAKAAQDIVRYMRAFLRAPDGSFFPSQDADVVRGEHSASYFALDDVARRRIGIPRVDPHRYTRETAWAIRGLLAHSAASGEQQATAEALAAARWIVDERGLAGGGYRHDQDDRGGPYLGDTVAAGRAFLALYTATGDASWLGRAEDAARFIARTFRVDGLAGFVTARPAHAFDRPRPQRDENIAVARLAADLDAMSPRPDWGDLRRHALRYVVAPAVARSFGTASVLLAVGPRANLFGRSLE